MSEFVSALRPLRVPAHVDRYKEVDNYIGQFNKFTAVFVEPAAWLEKGHLFIVAGDSGYGKTSLRQRCAFWMLAESGQNHCEVCVMDFSDESWQEETSDARLARIRDWILRDLDGPLDPDDLDRIGKYKDMLTSFKELALALRAKGAGTGKPIVLVVLLPGYPTPDELDRYYSLAREGMVFLAEIFDPDAIKDVTEKKERRNSGFRRDDIDSHVLELGVLKAGDDKLLIRLIQDDLQNCPKLTDPDVLANLNQLIEGRGSSRRGISTSQLMRLLIGSLHFAMDDQATEVSIKHINQYHQTLVYT